MDRILLDDRKLAKAMLLDEKVFEFSGKIIKSHIGLVDNESILLEQSSGYKIDLLARLSELAYNYGHFVSINYWISKTPKTPEELIEFNIMSSEGFLSLEYKQYEVRYSEYTVDTDYETIFEVRRMSKEGKRKTHNFMNEIKHGYYLYLLISFNKERR